MITRAGGRMALSILVAGTLVLGMASLPSARASADVAFGFSGFFPHAFGRHSGLGISFFSGGPYLYPRHYYYRRYAPIYYDPWWPPPVVVVRGDPPPASRRYRDDYYLNRRAVPEPALNDAVADIEDAFRDSNVRLLAKHVRPDDTLVVQLKDKRDRRISGKEYLDLTQDAFKDMETVRYTLGRPEPGSDHTWAVRGTHVVRGPDGRNRTYDVGLVLRKLDGDWVVTEVRARPAD